MVSLYIEQVPPVYLCCDMLITAEDVASAVRFQNEQRRREHLAWRRILRRELGRNISIAYNDVGAPYVNLENTWISISHGANMVAVAVADKPIGIDIESTTRNFERVKSRYMSEEELNLSSLEAWPAYVWTAKEAMYKLYGRRGIELTDDIRIVGVDSENMILYGQLENSVGAEIRIEHRENDSVVAVATFASL